MPAHDPAAEIRVGETWEVEGRGEREIQTIVVCLYPSTDPAGEDPLKIVAAKSCEFGVPFVVDLAGGNWAYKHQLLRRVSRTR